MGTERRAGRVQPLQHVARATAAPLVHAGTSVRAASAARRTRAH